MVRIAPPPPSRPPNPLFVDMRAGTAIVRIFDPTRHSQTPTSFRHNGPRQRFDHHRSPDGTPNDDPDRGITYTAFTLSGCLIEVFGDSGEIDYGDCEVALLKLKRDLHLLDLRGPGAMRAGANAAIGKTADRPLSQAWSRYFYDCSIIFGAIDGLVWYNAHNDEEAIALYERAANALSCAADNVIRLDDPALRPAVLNVALTNNLVPPR